MNKTLAVSTIVYILASILDDVITWFVAPSPLYMETNPVVASMLQAMPVWEKILLDIVVYAAFLTLMWVIAKLGLRGQGVRGGGLSYAILRRWYLFAPVFAVVRAIPVIHNIVLLWFGVSTPLLDQFRFVVKVFTR